jgi:hypothetical protein
MKRPSSVRILGRTYKIAYVPLCPFEGQPYGNCDNPNLTINILEGQKPIEERDTLLHEAMHALFYHMCIHLGDEEGIVRPTATGLIAVFQDNPEFAKYITQKI